VVFVPAKLRKLRTDAALSQHELAKMAGLAYSTVNKLENQREQPRPKTLRALARVLKVKPIELMGEDPI
jgi:transcriptional regulator with XRE-family HTH domain